MANYKEWEALEKRLRKEGFDIDTDYGQGIKVNNRYVVTANNRWRDLRVPKWYFYKDVDQLIEKYLAKNI